MMAGRLRDRILRHSSTSRRNRDVAGHIRPLLKSSETVLDAGCGEVGLAPFLSPAQVVGVDLGESKCAEANFLFIRGSITDLPLEDRSVGVAASVDTIEHLPVGARPAAIREMVRVARTAVVISFPRGQHARRVDDDYRRLLKRRNQPEPEWLAEHLAEPYPEVKSTIGLIADEARRIGRSVDVEVGYSEWLASARLLRWLSAYSERLAVAADLVLGPLVGMVMRPRERQSYRAIVVARFV